MMGIHPLEQYTRKGMMPHIWCPGCGDGIILSEFLRAINDLNIDPKKTVVVSGIGCIGRISGYVNMDGFHTTHGRAVAVAVGIKVAKPDLNVVVISGDGDLFSIGGNHFIHAARRNIDLTVICSNNFNYGMTGGQAGPTTLLGARTTTSPFGSIEHPFNLVHLAAASGAIYVARWTSIHIRRIRESMKKAMQKKGFKFIEIITPCPEQFGRRNRMRTVIDQTNWLREKSVIKHFSDPLEAEASADRIVVGEFVDKEKPEFTDLLRKQMMSVQERLDREKRVTFAAI